MRSNIYEKVSSNEETFSLNLVTADRQKAAAEQYLAPWDRNRLKALKTVLG